MSTHRPGTEAREELESVIAARLTWASMHWGTERVDRDAWPAIAAEIIAAGWKSPAEVDALRARLAAVKALHVMTPRDPLSGFAQCAHDRHDWPCATARALTKGGAK